MRSPAYESRKDLHNSPLNGQPGAAYPMNVLPAVIMATGEVSWNYIIRCSHIFRLDPGLVYQPRRCRSGEHTSELQSLMRISNAVFCLQNKRSKTRSSYSEFTT